MPHLRGQLSRHYIFDTLPPTLNTCTKMPLTLAHEQWREFYLFVMYMYRCVSQFIITKGLLGKRNYHGGTREVLGGEAFPSVSLSG